MNNGEESSRVEESRMDASPCSSLHYSSCGESEFDRYCSANSALGTPSVCGSTGPFHDSLDSDFENFSLGPSLKLSSFGKTRLGDRGGIGFSNERSGETSTENANTNIVQETDDLMMGAKVCDEATLERDSMNQLSDVDDNEYLCGSDREDGEHSDDDDDSLPDTDDHFRQNLCFPRNLNHKEESRAENHNPFLISSSTAFGTNDWDEFELEATELNDTPFDFTGFQERDKRCAENEGISTKLPDVAQAGKGIQHTNLTLGTRDIPGLSVFREDILRPGDLTVLNLRELGGLARDSITVRGSGDLSVDIKTSLTKEEFVRHSCLSNNQTKDRPVAVNYLQSCDADDVLDITPVESGNEDSSCEIGHFGGNVSSELLHESSEDAKQSIPFVDCTSEPLLASSNSDKPSSTDSHPVINALQVTNTQPKVSCWIYMLNFPLPVKCQSTLLLVIACIGRMSLVMSCSVSREIVHFSI